MKSQNLSQNIYKASALASTKRLWRISQRFVAEAALRPET